jgi:hypothetical protein
MQLELLKLYRLNCKINVYQLLHYHISILHTSRQVFSISYIVVNFVISIVNIMCFS